MHTEILPKRIRFAFPFAILTSQTPSGCRWRNSPPSFAVSRTVATAIVDQLRARGRMAPLARPASMRTSSAGVGNHYAALRGARPAGRERGTSADIANASLGRGRKRRIERASPSGCSGHFSQCYPCRRQDARHALPRFQPPRRRSAAAVWISC